MKFKNFAKQVILPSLVGTTIIMILWYNSSFRGITLTAEELPKETFIMFVLNLVGFGWIYIKNHL